MMIAPYGAHVFPTKRQLHIDVQLNALSYQPATHNSHLSVIMFTFAGEAVYSIGEESFCSVLFFSLISIT
jgi:hypothetical protein